MKMTLIALGLMLSVVGAATAQYKDPKASGKRSTSAMPKTAPVGTGTTLEQNQSGSVTSGVTDDGSTNAARPNSSGANPVNGTKATTGLNTTLEQNSAGTVNAGDAPETKVDARSRTTTTAPPVKAKTKPGELVNLKPNKQPGKKP